MQLHRNSVAEGFIKGNSPLLNVYGADANKADTWQYRHRVKHIAYSTKVATDYKSIRAAEYASGAGIAVKMIEDAEGQEWEIIHTTAVIDLAKVAEKTNAPQTVAVTFFYDGIPNSEFDDHDFKGTTWTTTGCSGVSPITPNKYFHDIGSKNVSVANGHDKRYATFSNVYSGNYNYPTLYTGPENVVEIFRKETSGRIQNQSSKRLYEWNQLEGETGASFRSYEFDISNLSEKELKNGKIVVTTQSLCHATQGDEFCAVGLFHYVTVSDKINDCDINGHNWITKGNDALTWANDYSTLTIKYTCDKKNSETYTTNPIKTTTTKSADGKTITYTAKGDRGETYTKVVNSSASAAGVSKEISLNSTNTSAKCEDRKTSSSTVYPGGSKSTRIYKNAHATINFTIANQISAGTEKAQFSFYGSKTLMYLNVYVYSGTTGKIIGMGGTQNPSTIDYNKGIITVTLTKSSNEDLTNAYVQITGEAQTMNWSSVHDTPSDAEAKIGVTNMKLIF